MSCPDGSTPTCDIIIQPDMENSEHAGNQCDINATVRLPSVSNGVQHKSVKAIIKTIVTKVHLVHETIYHCYERRVKEGEQMWTCTTKWPEFDVKASEINIIFPTAHMLVYRTQEDEQANPGESMMQGDSRGNNKYDSLTIATSSERQPMPTWEKIIT